MIERISGLVRTVNNARQLGACLIKRSKCAKVEFGDETHFISQDKAHKMMNIVFRRGYPQNTGLLDVKSEEVMDLHRIFKDKSRRKTGKELVYSSIQSDKSDYVQFYDVAELKPDIFITTKISSPVRDFIEDIKISVKKGFSKLIK